MIAKKPLFCMMTVLGFLGICNTTIASENEHLDQIAEECRGIYSGDHPNDALCLAYRILITELNVGDQIHTRVDEVFEQRFTLFNGFTTEYRQFKKSFMSDIRPNDKVILTKILPRHSACNLRSEIQHGLLIWNMKVPERNIQSNFEFTYTGTRKMCGDSSLNYNDETAGGAEETKTAIALLNLKYD